MEHTRKYFVAYFYIDSPFKQPRDDHKSINLTYLPIVIFSFEINDAVVLSTRLTISRCSNFTQGKEVKS